jgi:signal transduction histidine kinase
VRPLRRYACMSALAHTIDVPVEPPLDYAVAYDMATAPDLRSGLARVLSRVRAASGAARVEWWTGNEFVVAEGLGTGPQQQFDLGELGTFVFHGGRLDRAVTTGLETLSPILRRMRAEETLAIKAGELVRRNDALEEFAGFVAHELKTPLHEALAADDSSRPLREALDLVDALLRTAGDVRPVGVAESLADSLETVMRGLGSRADGVEVTSNLEPSLPITAGALQIILRNFLTNALSAGATHVHISTLDSSSLVVDDDGVGLSETGYESGSGLGLELCRRIAWSFGAHIELSPRRFGGTRATLSFGGLS